MEESGVYVSYLWQPWELSESTAGCALCVWHCFFCDLLKSHHANRRNSAPMLRKAFSPSCFSMRLPTCAISSGTLISLAMFCWQRWFVTLWLCPQMAYESSLLKTHTVHLCNEAFSQTHETNCTAPVCREAPISPSAPPLNHHSATYPSPSHQTALLTVGGIMHYRRTQLLRHPRTRGTALRDNSLI